MQFAHNGYYKGSNPLGLIWIGVNQQLNMNSKWLYKNKKVEVACFPNN